MSTRTYSVKLDEEKDAELIEWLESCSSKSMAIKEALCMARELPLPVQLPAPDAVPVALDTTLLASAVKEGVKDAMREVGQVGKQSDNDSILNELKMISNLLRGMKIASGGEEDAPVAAMDKNALLDDMLAGLEDFMQ